MTTIGVIIPFYQREAGLLRRALQSVAAQQLAADVEVEVVVVDDASPSPARDELADVGLPHHHRITVLEQPNGGPGAARNTALDHFAAHRVDFIALLDSDDEWTADHLSVALTMLGDDADFYFDDHTRVQYPLDESYFRTDAWFLRWRNGEGRSAACDGGYTLPRSRALEPFLESCLAQTSTVVFRHAPNADLRFDTTLRTLGEDVLFFMQLAVRAPIMRFSTLIGAHCGAGVNIYHSALSWDHPDAPMRFAYTLLKWTKIRQIFALSARDRRYVDSRIAGFHRGFAYISLRHTLRRRQVHTASFRLLWRQLGWGVLRSGPALLGALARKAARLPAFPEH